jgi:hypothetical protein
MELQPVDYIIIVTIIFVIYCIYLRFTKKEFLENIKIEKKTTDENFREVVTIQKLLRFKCKIGDDEYYLAVVPSDACEKEENKIDCSTSSFVLLNVKDADEEIEKYKKQVEEDIEVCLMKKYKCEGEACEEVKRKCMFPQRYITDFKVTEIKSGKKIRYQIEGIYSPLRKGMLLRSIMNHCVYDTNDVNIICGDIIDTTKSNTMEIFIDEDVKNDKLSVKMKMDVHKHVLGKAKDGTPKTTYFYDTKTGQPELMTMYIGKSTRKCKFNGKDYFRLKLFESKDDGNVISFEPIKL